jgi:hypothetical protein
MTKAGGRWGTCALLFLVVMVGYHAFSHYLQSSFANCEDLTVSVSPIGKDLSQHLVRRKCGMLYGGPFTVVKLSRENGLWQLLGSVELLEIEDDSGSIRPDILFDGQAITVGGVYPGMKYQVRDSIFGLRVQVAK